MVYRPAKREAPCPRAFLASRRRRGGRRMFEGIQRSLSEALKRLRGRGRLTEANIREGMQEVRKALLDADVNFTVVNDFIQRVTERSVGQEVLRTPRPQRADRQDRLRRTGRT